MLVLRINPHPAANRRLREIYATGRNPPNTDAIYGSVRAPSPLLRLGGAEPPGAPLLRLSRVFLWIGPRTRNPAQIPRLSSSDRFYGVSARSCGHIIAVMDSTTRKKLGGVVRTLASILRDEKPKPKPPRPAEVKRELTDVEQVQKDFEFQREHGRIVATGRLGNHGAIEWRYRR